MFKDEYQSAFSKVTASGETYRRVMNMTKQKKQRHIGSTVSKALIAAALTSMLAVTAGAAGNWFTAYFADNSEKPLSEEQVVFVEENTQTIDQSQTHNGYTLKVKSAITDGTTAYIRMGITAPEDIVLNATTIEGYDPGAPTILFNTESGKPVFSDAGGKALYGSYSYTSVEDNDGFGYTQDILFTVEVQDAAESFPLAANTPWKLRVEDLSAEYINTAFLEEFYARHAGEENFMVSDEDARKMNPRVSLAEGNWEFLFRFENCDLREAELITDPVSAGTAIGWDANNRNVYEDVNIISFKLRSLSATIFCDYDLGAPDFSDSNKQIHAVMKDGSSAPLRSSGGSAQEQYFLAESPILLDDVAYILLGDGTKIPMTEPSDK